MEQVASYSAISARALTSLLPDLGTLPGPRYLALAASVTGLLLDGRLTAGTRLPSERELAGALAVSRSTATAAYLRLADDGVLSRRRGSGSYLTLPPGTRVTSPSGRLHRPNDGAVLDLSIAALAAPAGLLEQAALRAVARLGGFTDAPGYQPYGITELRELVAARFTDRGVPTDASQILITNGAQHALDLMLRAHVVGGTAVLVDVPTYPGALDAIRAQGGRVVGVPLAADGGWDVTGLRTTLQQVAPRLAYLIPDFHNPTGRLIGEGAREAVLTAARRAGTTVVVDETFLELDLRDDPGELPRPMAAIADSVVTVGSLSKTVWGGLRVGWLRADEDLVSQLAVLRARSDMSGSVLDQLLACELLIDLAPIVALRRAEFRAKHRVLLAELARRLPSWRAHPADGGLFVWAELDAPDATGLTHLLEQRGVLLAPGARFAVDGGLERFLRIPFALPEPDLVDAVDRIAIAWHSLDSDPHPIRRASVRLPV